MSKREEVVRGNPNPKPKPDPNPEPKTTATAAKAAEDAPMSDAEAQRLLQEMRDLLDGKSRWREPQSDEEARAMMLALNDWFERKKNAVAGQNPAPVDPAPAPVNPASATVDPAPAPEPNPEPKEEAVPAGEFPDGPRLLYAYRSLETGKRSYTTDPFVADRYGGGNWRPEWWMIINNHRHHVMGERELLDHGIIVK